MAENIGNESAAKSLAVSGNGNVKWQQLSICGENTMANGSLWLFNQPSAGWLMASYLAG